MPVAESERGRPTKYKPEYAKTAEVMCRLGATDAEIAEALNVDRRTFYRWKAEYDDFCHVIKNAKDIADERVERSLYQLACGFEQEAVKIFQHEGSELIVPYTEKVNPNPTAAIFWLKNRRRALWNSTDEEPPKDHNITINLVDAKKPDAD